MKLWEDFVAMLLPQTCAACRTELVGAEALICTNCRVHLPRTHYHRDKNNPVARKFWGKVPVTEAFAYYRFIKNGRAQRLLHALKYYRQPELGVVVGHWYGAELKPHYAEAFDLVVPVPLHRQRERRRGYNQSERFAAGLAEALGVRHAPTLLQRTVPTDSQTRRNRLARWQNVATVFAVTDEVAIQGQRVLLVDDVVTTGATLEAAAATLLKAGAATVSVATIAAA